MQKSIHEALSTSEKHAKVSYLANTVWVFMLPHSDCEGRYKADAMLIKSQCMPYFDLRLDSVEKALGELAGVGLIHLYDVQGKRHLIYHDHNQWNPGRGLKWRNPRWHAPVGIFCPSVECGAHQNGDAVANGVVNADKAQAQAQAQALSSGFLEKKGSGEEKPPDPSDVPPQGHSAPEWLKGLELYEKDLKLINAWAKMVPVWMKTFPGVDIVSEVQKAHLWELSDVKRRKTNRVKFLTSWFMRAQDQASRNGVRGAVEQPLKLPDWCSVDENGNPKEWKQGRYETGRS